MNIKGKYYEYLNESVLLKSDGLYIGCHRIMTVGQEEVMNAYAKALVAERHQIRILEVGYGLGVFANEVERYDVKEHVIIECHPELCRRAKETFSMKSHVKVLPIFWQDLDAGLGKFDGIFYDVSSIEGDAIKQLLDFIDYAYDNLLFTGGKISFWYCTNKYDERILHKIKEKKAKIEFSMITEDELCNLPCKTFIITLITKN